MENIRARGKCELEDGEFWSDIEEVKTNIKFSTNSIVGTHSHDSSKARNIQDTASLSAILWSLLDPNYLELLPIFGNLKQRQNIQQNRYGYTHCHVG